MVEFSRYGYRERRVLHRGELAHRKALANKGKCVPLLAMVLKKGGWKEKCGEKVEKKEIEGEGSENGGRRGG